MKMINQDDIREFMNSFCVCSLETSEKPEFRPDYFNVSPAPFKLHTYQVHDQTVTMELPLSDFNRLVKIDKHLRSTIDKHEREFELQLAYPALREAYEQYKLLLELVR